MSNAGKFYFATQSAKGTGNTSGNGFIIPITDMTPGVNDVAQPQAPVIAGGAFPYNVYKSGTSGSLAVSMEVPGDHIGYMLYYLSGNVAVTDDTGPINGAQIGVDTYDFKMAANDFTLPWYTSLAVIEDLVFADYVDTKMLTSRFMFNAGGPLTAQFGMAAITPSFGSEPSGETSDTSPILVCSTADALLELDDTTTEANQVTVDLANQAAGMNEELQIGSPFRRDISILGRNGGVTIRRWVDADTFKDMYFGGSTTWSASPYEAKVEVRAASGAIIAGSEPWSLEFEATEVGFLGCRIAQAAQRITFMEQAGIITVPSSGEEFQFILGATADIDFTAVPS